MRLLFLLFLVCAGLNVKATNYYFSSTNGNDARSAAEASNPATPWKTLAKLNSVFSTLNPGDVIYFQRGDYFEGSITVTRSGAAGAPITFSAYGSGSNPVISGFSTLGGWVSVGNGIWETSVPGSHMVNQLLLNNEPKALGRYPNSNATNSGYLMHEAVVSRTQITDNELPGSPNFTGAEVVIRKARWVLDRDLVTNHSGTTIQYETPTSSITPFKNYGYYFQNHPATLDLTGEWYFKNATRKLGMYFGSANPSQSKVLASTVNVLVFIQNQHYINFENITFQGGNQKTIQIINGQNISITNCEILYSGINGIDANLAPNLRIERNVFNYSNNIAINANCSNAIIRSNKISNTGILRGMGQSGNHSYEAMMVFGDGNTIELNEILQTGYIPIYFDGNNVTVRNNFINYFGINKDDGGGIYTYNGAANATSRVNRKIINNIILNGVGAGEGSDQPANLQASGIYLDDNGANVQVSGNTVAFCTQTGIYIHNSSAQQIEYNTFYNNNVQLCINADKLNPVHPVRNVNIRENILFSSVPAKRLADYLSAGNEIGLFGTIDNNYYARPSDENATIKTVFNNGTYYSKINDLDGWKPLFSKDLNSKKSPWQLAPYRLMNMSTVNLYANGTFNSNITGVDHYSPQSNSVIAWSNNGKLDGGALQVSFSSNTGSDKRSSVTLNIGAVTANKNYVLRFSVIGTDENKTVETFLRKIGSPYNILTVKHLSKIKSVRTEYELLFTPTVSEASTCLVFNMQEQTTPVWFDNVKLVEADVLITKPEDSVRFEYNASPSSKTIQLDASYTDARNVSYQSSITLAPYSSAVLIRNTGTTATTPPAPAGNQVPVANAGADFTITLPSTATLNGTASKDPDGSILKYEWKQVSGPSGSSIASVNASTTAVSNLVAGTYVYELWIWDNLYMPHSDQVTVTVNPAPATPATNQAPTANAGTDATITLPVNSYTLNASGSSDPDGSILKYQWKQVSGPSTASIPAPEALTAAAGNLVQGTYVFELWIWDNKYMPASDQVTVTVKAATAVTSNQAPLARAGADATITLPINSYSLNGAASADPDGSILKYEWKQVSGPSTASIALPNSAITTAGNLVQGTYVFKLWIWDNQYMPAADEITVTVLAAPVQAPGVNQLPVANAGADLTVGTSTASLNGSASYDADGSIIKYQWTKESGPATFTFVNANAAITSVSGLSVGTYVFRLTIWDNKYEPTYDRVSVTVTSTAAAVVPSNVAPVAKAGNDISLVLPSSSVTLNGTASYDVDGNIIKYDWRKESGPAATIVSPNGSTTAVTGLVQGTYVFVLTIWDNKYQPTADKVTVTVGSGSSSTNALMIAPMEPTSITSQPLQAFPNPVINTVNLRMVNNDLGKVQMNMYDLSGKIIKTGFFQKQSHVFQQQLEVTTLIKGVYMVELIVNGTSKSLVKFVKQ